MVQISEHFEGILLIIYYGLTFGARFSEVARFLNILLCLFAPRITLILIIASNISERNFVILFGNLT